MKNHLLERPRLKSPGTFVLPQIASDIPARLGKETIKHQVLAKFALAAEAIGIPLPGGNFVSIEEVVHQQWANYLKATLGSEAHDYIAGNLEIVVSDNRLEARIASASNLVVLKLKPVITALESQITGLGWYVMNVLDRAGCHGMTVYDCKLLGYQAMCYLYEAETDEEMASALYSEEHGRDPKKAEIPGLIEEYRDSHMYFPSDVLAQVDGHKHLLGWPSSPEVRAACKAFNPKKAAAALSENQLSQDLVKCVQAAITLDKLISKDKGRAFTWGGEEQDPDSDEYYDDQPELVGAVCVLAWENSQMLLEMVEHAERSAYENGSAYEYQGHAFVQLDASSVEIKNLARALRAYFERWNAMAKLVSCFPFAQE